MKWPWSPKPSNRATLTFLPDGGIVLGFPPDDPPSPEIVDHVKGFLEQWRATPENMRMIVFPWPVDVVDLRR